MRVVEIAPRGKKKKRGMCFTFPEGEGLSPRGGCQKRTDSNAARSKGRISLCHSQSIKSILCNRLQTMATKIQKAPANKQGGGMAGRTVPWEREREKVIKSRADELHLRGASPLEALLFNILRCQKACAASQRSSQKAGER